jgi:hypothetical protein
MTIEAPKYSSNDPERFLSWMDEVLRGLWAAYPEFADAVEKTVNPGARAPDPSNDRTAAKP